METKNYCDVNLRTNKYCVDYWAAKQEITIASNRFKITLSRGLLHNIYGADFIEIIAILKFDVDAINKCIDEQIDKIIAAGRKYKIFRIYAESEGFCIDEPVVITDSISTHVITSLQKVNNYIIAEFEPNRTFYNLSQEEIKQVLEFVIDLNSGKYDTVQ